MPRHPDAILRTNYEWDAELTATEGHLDCEAGEVIDHRHCATFAEAVAVQAAQATDPFTVRCLVLVRDVGSNDEGLIDRSWAYLNADGTMPENFTDSYGAVVAKVPQRFHAEVAKVGVAR